jgi:hypothetical protein
MPNSTNFHTFADFLGVVAEPAREAFVSQANPIDREMALMVLCAGELRNIQYGLQQIVRLQNAADRLISLVNDLQDDTRHNMLLRVAHAVQNIVEMVKLNEANLRRAIERLPDNPGGPRDQWQHLLTEEDPSDGVYQRADLEGEST